MMPRLLHLILFIFFVAIQTSTAQSIIGFWEVKSVSVGDKNMTPVAKWTRIHQDGSYQSGNGGIQNSEGTWTFNKRTQFFLPLETNGLKDVYGGFKVRFLKDQMLWEREEDGEIVIVKLERIEKLPKSPADMLVGLWDLKEISENGQTKTSALDPNNKYYIFIRWDRIYVERTPQGNRETGYWYINAHHPEITLMSHGESKKVETWKIGVTDKELKMEGISDSNKGTKITYERLHEFPN
jgi:hypothetical protein